MLLAVAVAVWDLRREPRRGRRAALIALRVATGAFAWAVAVQPRWVAERFEESEGRIAVLADASRSMSLPRSGRARSERAEALLARWASEATGVPAFTFGDRLEAVDLARLAEALPTDADESGLGAALSTLLADESGSDLGAVVVVSDGADRSGRSSPGEAWARLARHGVRVHAVAISEDALRDDAVAEVEADPVGFLRRPARVRVVVRSLGGSGGPIPVTLRRGDQVEREVIADVPPNGEAEVEIPFTPTRLGREVYRVSIPRAPGDAVPENDERAFLVRVSRDKLRVLLVAGQPSWDERFLRSFLKRDPATDLISFFILRNTTDLTMAGSEELALIPFPTDELFNEHLGSFDLVVFQNFEYGPYQMASYLPRIRDYVMRGGSFAMIGGPLSFHSGGYASTPIAEILPVDLPPEGTPPARTVVTDRFAPRLTPGLERHPLLELLPDPAENAAAWARLAPLIGANVVTRVRSGAAVLLEHPEHRMESGGPLPLLVLGGAGQGRTLALTTDTTWRWGITTGGETGDASAYERFWDRAVRWLARDPVLEPARITTDRERYGPGARAAVRGQLRDARYVPYAERALVLRLLDLAGRVRGERQARTDREGNVETELELPVEQGAYRVEAHLDGVPAASPAPHGVPGSAASAAPHGVPGSAASAPQGAPEPLTEEWLVVEAGGDELADPRPDPALLAALAEATGGSFFASPEDAPALDELDATRTRSLGIAERAPLATFPAFLALVLLFVGEWILRRRWGRR